MAFRAPHIVLLVTPLLAALACSSGEDARGQTAGISGTVTAATSVTTASGGEGSTTQEPTGSGGGSGSSSGGAGGSNFARLFQLVFVVRLDFDLVAQRYAGVVGFLFGDHRRACVGDNVVSAGEKEGQ